MGGFLALLAVVPALAQPAPYLPEPAFQTYMKSDTFKRLTAQAVARVSPAVSPRCAKQVLGEPTVSLLGPVPIGPDGLPASGGWKQSMTVRGCGVDTVLNFQFFVAQDKRVITLVTNPGTTRADLQQQRDGQAQAVIALDAPAKGCRQFEVLDAKFEAYGVHTPPMEDPGPGAVFRLWHETWTLQGCGKTWKVPLNFLPNRLGTQIVQPGEIVTK